MKKMWKILILIVSLVLLGYGAYKVYHLAVGYAVKKVTKGVAKGVGQGVGRGIVGGKLLTK